MKKPDREPDLITKYNKYWFEELVRENIKEDHVSEIIDKDGILYTNYNEAGPVTFIDSIQKAYSDYLIEKELLR